MAFCGRTALSVMARPAADPDDEASR